MDFSKLVFSKKENTLESELTKSDKQFMELLNALEKIKKDTKKRKFQEWLNYDISDLMFNQKTTFYVKDAINELIKTVNDNLTLYGYTIKDQKHLETRLHHLYIDCKNKMSDYEDYEDISKEEIIKTVTIEEFLENDKTREILEQEHFFKYEIEMEKK